MSMIGERGFPDYPDHKGRLDLKKLTELREQQDLEIGTKMDALAPRIDTNSVSNEEDGPHEVFSESVQYQSPTNPDIIIDAFLSRDTKGMPALNFVAYDTVAEDSTNYPKIVMKIEADKVYEIVGGRRIIKKYGLIKRDGNGNLITVSRNTVDECNSAHDSVDEVLIAFDTLRKTSDTL